MASDRYRDHFPWRFCTDRQQWFAAGPQLKNGSGTFAETARRVLRAKVPDPLFNRRPWECEDRMRMKTLLPGSMMLAVLAVGTARAEDFLPVQGLAVPLLTNQLSTTEQGVGPRTSSLPYGSPTEELKPYGTPPHGPIGDDGVQTPACVSDWIRYTCPQCCGPVGRNGPIGYEMFLRTGPSMPSAGQRLHKAIQTGWLVEGGARTLLFNPPATAAWTAEFDVGSIFNNGGHPEVTFPLGTTDQVSVRRLNRTGIKVVLGREQYLFGSAWGDGCNLRFGWDAGARYDSVRIDLNDFLTAGGTITPNGFLRRKDDVMAVVLAAHTDLEWPLGGCKLQVGGRIEWAYTWEDIIPSQRTDISDLNFLLTLGIRF
jgi:hypothetical protein